MNQRGTSAVVTTIVIMVVVLGLILTCMWGVPKYRVWQKELSGEAKLREAEWSRQIVIREKMAEREGAVFTAQAESIRAEGVAKANLIIGEGLQGNSEYLTYLWIQSLAEGQGERIYVATEANLPLFLEAGR